MADSMFSWELEGSMASLLGTGVMLMLFRLMVDIELDFVVSFKHWDIFLFCTEVADPGEGLDAELASPAALEKKPKMLCCLPVDPEGVLVDRAGVAVLPAILTGLELEEQTNYA